MYRDELFLATSKIKSDIENMYNSSLSIIVVNIYNIDFKYY